MARRQIRFDQIGKHMEGEVLKLVRVTTLEWEKRVKQATPVRVVYEGEDPGGGDLRNAWESKVEGFVGEVNNRQEYAAPVCYGVMLPESWGGKYRTRQGTVPGFPDIIGKELQSWAQGQYKKIVRES
tara:strand:+ start:368 stop:748 length:381 start_codon:yes stop_codon:yes gene_type:complete